MVSLDLDPKTFIVGLSLVATAILLISNLILKQKSKSKGKRSPGFLETFLLFFYACFVKPHGGKDNGTQQDSLESFYKKQAGIYDRTRKILLQGREDMLALSASQLLAREKMRKNKNVARPIWVDVSVNG